ncbi:citrate transporter family protein [Ralstonia insidiosa]|uniref:Citrate transporter family protein n=1 Tax=Ralstonia insidiosa TaxID=190721 RepID=A0AAC9BM47_9RALS|nr:citrate transporter family protein [Ralstonia insidiosa]GAQ26482.1 citMHS family citrate/H+ symporter [Ralstonia sp. NT80]
MLALLGLLTIVALFVVILTKRMSPLVALIAIPVIAALVGGFGLNTSKFIIGGIKDVAPVAGMFIFAILYFGIVTDAGMLDPIIDRILRTVGSRPPRIVVGSALLALLIHLDGSGAVAFLITIPAMLPLYDRLGMDRRILACVTSMACGVNLAVDGADDPRLRVAAHAGDGHLQPADPGADCGARLRVRVRVAAGQA